MKGKRSKLEELQLYLDGKADEATVARIEAERDDANSELRGFFEVMRERCERFGPTDIDWNQFFD